MNRIFCTLLLIGLSQCATAKGKVKVAPPACPPCPAAPTPSHALEDKVLMMFNYTEAGDFEAAAAFFKPGMDYLTNGQRYDIDLSHADAIKSIPYRTRKSFVFNQLDDHEIWAHCLVDMDGTETTEMLIAHFDDSGLIDLFSHVEPKGVQCSAVAKPVVQTKLMLRLVNGTTIDAPQDQLEAMLAQQAAHQANATASNATSASPASTGTAESTGTSSTTNSTSTGNSTASDSSSKGKAKGKS